MTSNISLSIFLFTTMTLLTGCELGCTRDDSIVLVGTICSAIEGPINNPVVGNAIGLGIEEVDYPEANKAFEEAKRVAVGEKVYWKNPMTEHWGSFKPIRDCSSVRGEYCREFVTSTYVDRKHVESQGKACRRRDGSWYLT